jgi:hypothetical protein
MARMISIKLVGPLSMAILYLLAWWNPSINNGQALARWVAFEKIGLMEFLSIHAGTLLTAFVLATTDGDGMPIPYPGLCLIALYVFLGCLSVLFHGSWAALVPFFLLCASRGWDFYNGGSDDVDILRSIVIKNFLMIIPLMGFIFLIAFTDSWKGENWSAEFVSSLSFGEKLRQGRPLLITSAYYFIWTVVEFYWPLRISK